MWLFKRTRVPESTKSCKTQRSRYSADTWHSKRRMCQGNQQVCSTFPSMPSAPRHTFRTCLVKFCLFFLTRDTEWPIILIVIISAFRKSKVFLSFLPGSLFMTTWMGHVYIETPSTSLRCCCELFLNLNLYLKVEHEQETKFDRKIVLKWYWS